MTNKRLWRVLPAVVGAVLLVAVPLAAQEGDEPMEPATTAAAQMDEPAMEEEEAPAAADPEEPSGVVSGAVSTTADAVATGAEQGRQVWREALVPMWQRFLAAIPNLLKAFGLLIVFWIAAIAIGAGVTKLLGLTDIDNRAADEWGLGEVLQVDEAAGRSIEKMAGSAIKWFILLFGFVAFFNALNLDMVAGPIQGILDQIIGVVPALLKATAILLFAWIIATVVKLAITRLLGAIGFDQRAERFLPARDVRGERVGPSAMIGRLIFYIILLLAMPLFLDALGQQALVDPLRDMFTTMFGYVPNLVGALIIVFIGRIIATVLREILTNLLAAAGIDRFAERFGVGTAAGTQRLSEIVGAVAYFFVFVLAIIAAVDKLQISAISEPVKATLEQLLSAIPLIFLAIILLAVGYYIAKAVRGLVESFLTSIGFDGLPEKLGLNFLKPRDGGTTLSSLTGTVVMVVILLLVAEQALAKLALGQLSELVGTLIAYLPKLVVGLAIIMAALSLGGYVARLISEALAGSGHGGFVSTVAKWAIFFLGFSMGLSQLGVGTEIVQVAVSAVLGGSALALGLAFGLGGRDKAKEVIDRTSSQM